MPHTLLLRLPAPGEKDAEWLSLDASGAPTNARQRGPLSLAAAVGRSARVIVLVPATQVLLAEPELPPGSGAKLARAVPFALEEQLTEDVDKLVFAIGKRRAAGATAAGTPVTGTPVAVVARSVLSGWLAELEEVGIEPSALYADVSMLPQNPGQSVLWYEAGRLSVRRPERLPFAVELSPIAEALVVAGIIADPLGAPETHILESAIFYVTREDWGRIQSEMEPLTDKFASLKIQLLADGPLPWLARNLAAADAVNLLQGEFARTPDYGSQWRRWRTAAVLAAALIAVHVIADAVQLRQAKKETAALDDEIAQLFAVALPSQPVRDPRRQMEQRLERIRHSGPGGQYFLHGMQALSDAVGATPNTRVDSLNYHEGALDLKVDAPSLATLSSLNQVMAQRGMAAEIQSSTPVSGGVEAHLQIRVAGQGTAGPGAAGQGGARQGATGQGAPGRPVGPRNAGPRGAQQGAGNMGRP
jgi:general secretion pathway protein L